MPKTLSFPNGETQTASAWLTARMIERRIGSGELFQLMPRHGFRAGSPNVISIWKHGKTPILLSTLPYLLKALGMSAPEMKLWSRCFLRAEHPDAMALIEEAA
jgi:hypothetical protein